MKWIGLAILLGSIWPVLSWLRKHPDKLTWLCFMVGILPFVSDWYHLLAAPIAWVGWVGYTKGLEIYAIDAVALVLLMYLRGRLVWPPFIIPMMLYFIASMIATFGAVIPIAGAFYCWQLLRVFLVFFAVANVTAVEFNAVTAILKGLAAGEILECGVAVWQRFGQHVLQTAGTMGSQNELGIASHFVIFPFFAILLGGRRGWLPAVVVIAGLLADALTTSRASVGLALVGLGLVTLLSAFARFSTRKLAIVLSGLAVLALVAPLALASFGQRFGHGEIGLAEDHERLAFKRAAEMMQQDYPSGVGPNNFAVVANSGGYYRAVGNGISNGGFSTNVHNVYILILTEAGPAGMASYILMLIAPLITALRYGAMSGSRDRDDPKRDILIGISVTLLILCIHSTEEWVPIVSASQYLLAIAFGLVAGLSAEQRVPKTARNLGLSATETPLW